MTGRSRPGYPLRVILDIPSLKNEHSVRILRYEDNDLFEFIAVGGSSRFTELKTDFVNNVVWIEKEYYGKHRREEHSFPYPEEMLTNLAAQQDVKLAEVKLFYIAVVLASRTNQDQKVIMVTERKKLFNYKQYFHTKLPDFTIFSPEEARIFIDLFCKRHGKYFVKPHHLANRGLWYLYSMRSKLHQFQLAWSVNAYSKDPLDNGDKKSQMMGSISNRMKDMLKAIDEIGVNYYKGSNNDTMDDMLYHFNYWITLYSGILDALAWVSLYRYCIPAPNENKVALGSGEVLTEIYKHNPKLKEVISKNRKIIDLVYEPRNLFIHREMLHGLSLKDYQASLELNMIDVEGDFLSHIRALQPVVQGGLNKAGLYEVQGRYLLEPYRFVKFATRVFIDFLNQYVSTLEYDQLLVGNQALKEKIEAATKTIPQTLGFDTTKFQELALGY